MNQFSEQKQINTAVIFDMDGVLIDSMPMQHESWVVTAEKEGMSISIADVMKLSGHTSRNVIDKLWSPHRTLTQDEILRIDDEKEREYRRILSKEFPVMPGAASLIKLLVDNGIDIAIGSSSSKENVEFVIEQMQIEPYLRCFVHGSDILDNNVVQGKPEPDIFILAAKCLGREPHECLVIEDARAGVIAAKRAGMKCIAFCSRDHTQYEYEGEYEGYKYRADAIVNSLEEITLQMVHDLLAVP